jgi:tRNA guanosine-2'-O-methyltransferase
LNPCLLPSLVSGNLIVGRYKDDFFRQCQVENVKNSSTAPINIHTILAGVIPWLSSTQGFSRAVAQLLTYRLIPLVVENPLTASLSADSDWYLRSVYRFLHENPEMQRLRRKQEHFFERYEVDSVCTPEGVFSIPVDESHEANPVQMIDVIKECLQEVYDEGNMDRAPLWKQMEMVSKDTVEDTAPQMSHEVVNFQRKIIPIDELNVALDSLNEQKYRNLSGRRKQKLIVCATLIDKVPNLGGLARTCEIFALDRLVVPDLQITKMDNFKNLCVGAGDWIEIEECSELVCSKSTKSDSLFIVNRMMHCRI